MKTLLVIFGSVLLAELGDKTQLATSYTPPIRRSGRSRCCRCIECARLVHVTGGPVRIFDHSVRIGGHPETTRGYRFYRRWNLDHRLPVTLSNRENKRSACGYCCLIRRESTACPKSLLIFCKSWNILAQCFSTEKEGKIIRQVEERRIAAATFFKGAVVAAQETRRFSAFPQEKSAVAGAGAKWGAAQPAGYEQL